jgi:hypothetical protein
MASKGNKDILDAESAKEKRQLIFGLAGGFGAFLIYIGVSTPIFTNTVFGVTETLSAVQTDDGSKPIVSVRLESGEKVVARLPTTRLFQKNEKAEFVEARSVLGKRTYRFIQYVE